MRGDTREGLFCVPEGQSITNAEDLFGHITNFEGCLECFSDVLEQNPLAKSIFKLLWHLMDKHKIQRPINAGGAIQAKF